MLRVGLKLGCLQVGTLHYCATHAKIKKKKKEGGLGGKERDRDTNPHSSGFCDFGQVLRFSRLLLCNVWFCQQQYLHHLGAC